MEQERSLIARIFSGFAKGVGWLIGAFARLSAVLLFIVVGLLVGGFFQFAHNATSVVVPSSIQTAQGVVVLTGGSERISKGLDIIAEQPGKRLLISGVNKETSTNTLRAMNTSRQDLFDCCVDIGRDALDTIGNAIEAKYWAAKHNFTSIAVVTSGYHLPRSMNEFRRIMPQTTLIGYPVQPVALKDKDWWKDSSTLRIMVSEYVKYLGSSLRSYVPENILNVVRSYTLGN